MSVDVITAGSREAGPIVLSDTDAEIRRELIAAIHELHRAGVLPYTGSSNGSVRLKSSPDLVLLSARGLREDVGIDDFGVVTLDDELVGGWLDGHVQPVIGMHTAVYRQHLEVEAVLHTHSTSAASFAVARTPIPLNYEPLLYRGQREAIPVTKFGLRNHNSQLVSEVAHALSEHPNTKAVLLANHGLLAWDTSPAATAQLIVTIEEAATIILGAERLGGSKPIALGPS